MRYQGKIINWKDDQGYGFVVTNGSTEKSFVHIKSFSRQTRRPTEGDLITYELAKDEKNRQQAVNIRFSNEKPYSPPKDGAISFSTIFAISFCIILALGTIIGKVHTAIAGTYILASLLTYFAYSNDKAAAQENRWRTKESTLHLFGLFGGWPGALVAQKILRHKSKKQEFQFTFWGTVIMNCCAFGWLFSKSGSEFLKSLLGS